MEHIVAHNYLTNKCAIFICGFEDKKKIKTVLNCEMIGNKYYIMYAEYPNDYDYGYIIRPVTLVDVEHNFDTGKLEFFFQPEAAIFPHIEEGYLPEFVYKIEEGNSKYQLYTYAK